MDEYDVLEHLANRELKVLKEFDKEDMADMLESLEFQKLISKPKIHRGGQGNPVLYIYIDAIKITELGYEFLKSK